MQSETAQHNNTVRYEPDEQLAPALSLGLGFQYVALTISGIVLTPAVIVRAAGGDDSYLSWAVFAALLVSGVTTALQARRVGRVGAGYVLLMGTSGTFIAVCISAMMQGGPGLLAILVLLSSLFQFLLSSRLALFRRLITPAVAGTVIMLISVTIMPISFDLLTDTPAGAPAGGAFASAAVTLLVTVLLGLGARGVVRLWAPLAGVVAGCLAAGWYGMYDIERVRAAAWVGFPDFGAWPGFDLEFGPAFWALLPAFIFVTMVGAIETIGDAVAIQNVSWRRRRATDFRAVQGAVAADGVGNLLSGAAGTVPNTTYSSSIALTEITGVAARRVGIYAGGLLFIIALLPKFMALLLAIPNPVIASYLLVVMGILFVLGMQIVMQGGLDYRKAIVVGVSFWIGSGFQNGLIFADYLGDWPRELLSNGMTAGGLAAIVMTIAMELASGRRRRVEMEVDDDAPTKLKAFVNRFAADKNWSVAARDRINLAAEEAYLVLAEREKEEEKEAADERRRILLVIRDEVGVAELEFVLAAGSGNIEDRIALLSDQAARDSVGREISLRLLRHFASSVRHHKYRDAEVVIIRVDVAALEAAAAGEQAK